MVQGEAARAGRSRVQRSGRRWRAEEGGGTTASKLQNIRSVAGFERRLNDVTCSGCHQTRGIGGFHFPGVDWMADEAVQFDRRAGLAAFLWRPGPPPRHP